jgi:hypothetical protein
MKEPKYDCFAFNGQICGALERTYCRYGECGFYKPKGTECKKCKYEHAPNEFCEKCKRMRQSV